MKKDVKEVRKLTDQEMHRIEVQNLNEQYHKQRIECYNLKIEILNKESEILRFKKMSDMQNFNGLKSNYVTFINNIKTRFGIEKDFGFDPATGELID